MKPAKEIEKMHVRMCSNRNFYSLLVEMQNGTVSLTDSLVFSYNTKHLPYNPEISLLGIYSKELKTNVHTKTCRQMFIVAFNHNCQNLEATKMSSVGEWINKC